MTAPAPRVPNHLIREIMRAIQLHGNGDAMGCLAISSKEAFSVFKYVISHDVIGCLVNKNGIESIRNPLLRSTLARNNDIDDEYEVYRTLTETDWIKNPRSRFTLAEDTDNDDEMKVFRMSPVEFNMEALHTIATRYLQKLRVQLNRISSLPKLDLEYDITELTVSGCIHHDEPSLIPILDSWENLQSFKVEDLMNISMYKTTEWSIDHVRSVVLRSKNLSRLDFKVRSCQLKNLLTTAFPFPETVTLRCHFDDNNMSINFARAQTFPGVKQLHFHCSPEVRLTFKFILMLRNIVQCFPSLNVAKLNFNSSLHNFSHDQNGNNEITDWYEWLNTAAFSVPVEISNCMVIKFTDNDNIDPLYAHLKSIGFIENGKPYHLITERKLPKVKLIHRIIPNRVLLPFDQDIMHMLYSVNHDEDVIGEEWMNE